MTKDSTLIGPPVALLRLRLEFGLFYIGLPLLIAVLFPPNWMFPALFALTGLGIVLLHQTPGLSMVRTAV